MKRTKKIAAFLILFLCASMLLVLPTSAKSRKKYDLKVSDVKVSSKNLKPGDKCKISMKIVNRGYGKMKNVYVCYDSPSTQMYYVPLQYKKRSGRWVGNFKVEKGMQKGTWRIWSIDVNRVFDDIYAPWYAYYNHNLGNRSYPGSDLSKGNIKIRKTKADHKKPEIHADTLQVEKVADTEKGGKISCRIKVTDSSSIKRVTLTLKGPVSTDHPVATETEIEMKYNKKTGYYEGSVNKEKGTYRVENVYAEDVFGNHGWKEIPGYQLEL